MMITFCFFCSALSVMSKNILPYHMMSDFLRKPNVTYEELANVPNEILRDSAENWIYKAEKEDYVIVPISVDVFPEIKSNLKIEGDKYSIFLSKDKIAEAITRRLSIGLSDFKNIEKIDSYEGDHFLRIRFVNSLDVNNVLKHNFEIPVDKLGNTRGKEYSIKECPICLEFKAYCSLPCGHTICPSCLDQWSENCSLCREAIPKNEKQKIKRSTIQRLRNI